MNGLKYIGLIVLLSCSNLLLGQTVTSISPNPACIGDIVTITGTNLKTNYLKLVHANGSIDLKNEIQAGATTTEIKVELKQSKINNTIFGTVNFEVKEDGGNNTVQSPFILNQVPDVTLDIQGGNNPTICPGESKVLDFEVSDAGSSGVMIIYSATVGGNTVKDTTVASGNGHHFVTVSPTATTSYEVESIILGICTYSISNQSQTITVSPIADVTLTIQGGNNPTICSGVSSELIFTVSNAGNNSVLVNYEVNGILMDTTIAAGNGTHSLFITPTITTVYEIKSIVLGMCTNVVSNQSQTITVLPAANVILAVQGSNTICEGESAILNFAVSNAGNNSVKIHYKVDANLKDTTVIGDGIHSLSVFPMLGTTSYEIESIVLGTCTTSVQNQSQDITVLATAGVTLSLQQGSDTICFGEDAMLDFTVSSAGNNSVTVFYEVNGVLKDTIINNGDGTHSLTINPIATVTYEIKSIVLGTCTTLVQNQSEQIVVRPEFNGTLSVSSNTICNGDSVNLFFTANNPNSEELKFHYTENGISKAATTTGTFVAVMTSALTTSTTFTLNSIENTETSCTVNNINQTETIAIEDTMAVTMTSSVPTGTSLCGGGNYDLIFTIIGGNLNNDITIVYSKDGTTITTLNFLLNNTNTHIESITATQTHLYSLISITNNTTGCTTNYTPSPTTSLQVNITQQTTASIFASSSSICENSSINLIISFANPAGELITIKYQANGGPLQTETTSTNSAIISKTLLADTTYTLVSVTTASGCSFNIPATNNSVTIDVNKMPVVSISGGGEYCNGSTAVPVIFDISNINLGDDIIVRYKEDNTLQPPLVITATAEPTITHTIYVTPSTTTIYSLVSIENTTQGCTNSNVSASANVTVTAGNNLTGRLEVSSDEVCAGESVTLDFIINGVSGTTDLTYTTNGNNPQTITVTGSTFSQPISNLTSSTIFQLIEVIGSNTTCPGDTVSNEATKYVKVNSLPVATLTVDNGSNTTDICTGQSVDLEFDIINGTPPYSISYVETVTGFNTNFTFAQSLSTDTILTINPPIQPTSTYQMTTISDANSCQDVTLTSMVNITENPVPSVTLDVNDNVLCAGETAILTFTVTNNNNENVEIEYTATTILGTVTNHMITTNGMLNEVVTPDSTITYEIINIENIVTGCTGTSSGNSETIIVNELPKGNMTIDDTTICNGSNALLEFNFPSGISPFIVSYDSTSTGVLTSALPQTATLTTGSLINQTQNNTSNSTIENIYFITKIIDGNGCITDYTTLGNQPSDTIDINPTPQVDLAIVGSNLGPYASTDPSNYVLSGTPIGGDIVGAGVGITTTISTVSTTANFIPANVGFPSNIPSLDIDLSYTYIDLGTSCVGSDTITVTLKEALKYEFYIDSANIRVPLDSLPEFCRNDDALFIYATVLNDNGTGVDPVGINQFDLTTFNSVFSNSQVIHPDTVRVTLTPSDSSGTFLLKFGSVLSGFFNQQITVIDTINTSFSPYFGDTTFCQNDGDVRLIGIPTLLNNTNAFFYSSTAGLITSDTISTTNIEWYMNYDITGTHAVKYTYTDTISGGSGCQTEAWQNVIITPKPTANFITDIDCNNKDIEFTDNSIFNTSLSVPDSIVTWEWELGDGTNSIRDNDSLFNHQYNNSDEYTITLKVTSSLGCIDDFIDTVIIGEPAVTDFLWNGTTLGEQTLFRDSSIAIAAGFDDINNFTWDFGDGSDSITSLDSIFHEYLTTGVYPVSLITETNNGCVDTMMRNIYILPKITTYPYYERFNSSNGEWVANPVDENVWHWADSIMINNPTNRVWVTDSIAQYPLGRDIFVYSPVFDLTSLKKPLLSFRYWINSRVSDGAVIQYSTNDGTNWEVLGDLGSGLEWFHVENLVAQPGEQDGVKGFGWSGDSTSWKVARHKLDMLTGENNVRFRIAFGSVLSGTNASLKGFAFDDFFIGERQKLVLVERFTHVGDNSYTMIRDSVYNMIDDNKRDIVLIEYHNDIPNTGIPSNDNFNLFNPADPSARSLYYQYSETGKMAVDGDIRKTATGLNLTWTQNGLDSAMLEEPVFNISIDEFSVATNRIDVMTTVKARKSRMANSFLKLYIAVVQDSLVHNGVSGKHISVLRKLIPTAAGKSLTNSWNIGTSISDTSSYIPELGSPPIDTANLKVIVWLQSDASRKVFQVASSDLLLPNIPYDSMVVNTQEPLNISEATKFMLFPNPNNGNFTVQFETPIATKSHWHLIDINGKIVHQDEIRVNERQINIATNNLPKGLYFFRLYNEEGVSEVRKVLIQ